MLKIFATFITNNTTPNNPLKCQMKNKDLGDKAEDAF